MLQCEDVLDTTNLCGVHYPFLEDQAARAHNNHAWEKFLNQKISVLMIPGNHFEPFKPENVSEPGVSALKMRSCFLTNISDDIGLGADAKGIQNDCR
jgi:hypothetical protein